jgi:hypothetical protein
VIGYSYGGRITAKLLTTNPERFITATLWRFIRRADLDRRESKGCRSQPCKKPAVTGMTVCLTHGGSAPQVRAAAALRLAMLAVPAVQALKEILQDKRHPQRMRTVTEVLDRNGINAVGKPEPTPATVVPPTQQTTFNASSLKFDELSDEGLDFVGQVLKAIVAREQAVIDVTPKG